MRSDKRYVFCINVTTRLAATGRVKNAYSEISMKFYKYCTAALFAVAFGAHSAVLLTENFDNVSTLAGAGWVVSNTSTPVGTTSWFQGNSAVFDAQAGAPNSYIAANFLNTSVTGGAIINTLYTPQVFIASGITLSFWARTDTDPDLFFSDRLRVLYSSSGASTTLANFTSLTTINQNLVAGSFPQEWTLFSATISGLSVSGPGRFALQYNVPLVDSSQNPVFANYVGIDSVTVTSVPTPGAYGLLALGLLAAFGVSSRNNRRAIAAK
jgi:IPTL-CTERM motif